MAEPYSRDELQERFDARDSSQSFAYLNNAVLDIKAEALLLKKTVDALNADMRGLQAGITETQRWVKDNSEVARQTRDILISFETIGRVAKWMSAVGVAVGLGFAAMKGYFSK